MVSHLPAMLPVAVGAALAFRIREEKRVAVGWLGEGLRAPGTRTRREYGRCPAAADGVHLRQQPVGVLDADASRGSHRTHRRPRPGVRFKGVLVHGTDVLAVYREAKRAIEKAREGGGPTLIECLTLRMEGHAVHDDASYVPKDMFESWAKSDPIEHFRTWLRDQADLSDREEEELASDIKKLLNDAIQARRGGTVA